MPVISVAKQKADALRSIQDFGETLRFRATPNGEGRDVTGVVTRTYAAALDQMPSSNAPVFVVMVLNDATDGIAASEVRDGISTLAIPNIPGDTPQNRTVQRRHDTDEAVMYLECR